MPQSPKFQGEKHHDFDHHTVRLDYRIYSSEDVALFLKPRYTPNDQPSPIAGRQIKLREAKVSQSALIATTSSAQKLQGEKDLKEKIDLP